MILIVCQDSSPVQRPSHSELRGKIVRARQKIAERNWLTANFEKLLPEFHDLNRWTAEEQSLALEAAANEIVPEHYVGGHPPQRAYEEVCKGAELFAFAWESRHFGRWMYFKFCFVKETFFVVSVHADRPRRGEEPK